LQLRRRRLELLRDAIAERVVQIGVRPVELRERLVSVGSGEVRVVQLAEARCRGVDDGRRLEARDERDALAEGVSMIRVRG
jgi:hypothetical protein